MEPFDQDRLATSQRDGEEMLRAILTSLGRGIDFGLGVVDHAAAVNDDGTPRPDHQPLPVAIIEHSDTDAGHGGRLAGANVFTLASIQEQHVQFGTLVGMELHMPGHYMSVRKEGDAWVMYNFDAVWNRYNSLDAMRDVLKDFTVKAVYINTALI